MSFQAISVPLAEGDSRERPPSATGLSRLPAISRDQSPPKAGIPLLSVCVGLNPPEPGSIAFRTTEKRTPLTGLLKRAAVRFPARKSKSACQSASSTQYCSPCRIQPFVVVAAVVRAFQPIRNSARSAGSRSQQVLLDGPFTPKLDNRCLRLP